MVVSNILWLYVVGLKVLTLIPQERFILFYFEDEFFPPSLNCFMFNFPHFPYLFEFFTNKYICTENMANFSEILSCLFEYFNRGYSEAMTTCTLTIGTPALN